MTFFFGLSGGIQVIGWLVTVNWWRVLLPELLFLWRLRGGSVDRKILAFSQGVRNFGMGVRSTLCSLGIDFFLDYCSMILRLLCMIITSKIAR